MSDPDGDAAQLLHTLGYLNMRSGQPRRALAFLLLAHRIHPHDAGILLTLAAGFIANEAGERALGVVDRLQELEGGASIAGTLLRARALWLTGSREEARRCFRAYVDMRKESR